MRSRLVALVAVVALLSVSCTGDDDVITDVGTASTVLPSTVASAPPTAPAIVEPGQIVPPASDTTGTVAPAPDVTTDVTTDTSAAVTPAPSDTSDTTGTVANATESEHTIELIGCEQVAIYLPVDVAATVGRIPDGTDLVVEEGLVTSLYLAHECADVAVDGERVGPTHLDVQWLPVVAPDEVRVLPQFEGVPVLPTATWTATYYVTDNATLQQLARDVGLDMLLADAMTFSPYTDVVNGDGFYEGQAGQVTAVNLDPPVDYAWASIVFGPSTVPIVDNELVFVHVVDGFDAACRGRVVVDAVAGGVVVGAAGASEPIPAASTGPGTAYTVLYDSCPFTS